jgi:hypothetical protein
MKLPELAPELRTLISGDSEKLVSLLTSDEARKYVEKANQEYLHWEKAKYRWRSCTIIWLGNRVKCRRRSPCCAMSPT